MAKVKPDTNKAMAAKDSSFTLKQGSVQKKKNQKFAQTPKGKVALVNGSKQQNNKNVQPKKDFKKGQSASPQKNGKQSPGKNNKKANKLKELVPKDDESDSDEDYNEGIVPQEESSFAQEDDDSDDDDADIPNILGASLGDDSDDDDEDFDEDDDEDDEEDLTAKNKGVKMFKGLNTSSSSSKSGKSDSNDDDDDDDDDDEDDDDAAPGLKALLGNSLADDDDDEDFEEEEEDDEDDDISDEDDEEGTLNTSQGSKASSTPELSPEEQLAVNKRTIFVGNVPKEVEKTELEKLFKKYGPIENLRVRGLVAEDINMPKKVAVKAKKLHDKIKTYYAFICFKSESSAKAALKMNGHVLNGNYLRVDTSVKEDQRKPDPKTCVFIGNLPFRIENNDVWEHFKDCGAIESVRIVKENRTGVSKGFGYINFKSADSVALALEMNGTQLKNREVRVSPYSTEKLAEAKNKDRQTNKRPLSSEASSSTSPKKFKNDGNASQAKQNKVNAMKRKANQQKGNTASPEGKGAFQGQKADAKQKKKVNKMEKKKRVMAAKLTAKSKKPTN